MDEALAGLDFEALSDGQLDIFNKFYNLSLSDFSYDKIAEYLEITNIDANIITNIWNALLPMAVGFLTLYFVIHLMTEFASGRKEMTYKDIVLGLLKFVLGYALICNGPELIGNIASIGNSLLSQFGNMSLVSGATSSDMLTQRKEFAQKLYEKCKELKSIHVISLKTDAWVASVLGALPMTGLYLQAIGRKFELILRGGFSCIALSNVYSGDMRSGAIKYLKRFAAVCVQGVGIAIVVKVAADLNGSRLLEALLAGENGQFDFPSFSTIVNGALYNFAAVGAVPIVKQIINDVLD